MATTGHENESINVGGLKSSLQALKTKYVDNLDSRVDTLETAVGSGGSVDTRISNAIKDLDSSASQTAGTDGLALSITETDGKITSISGSIATNIYDTYGAATSAANTAKTDVIGGATTNGNTLKKLEDRVSPLESAVGSGGSVDTRIATAVANESARAQAVESTLQAQYNALTQSDIIVGALPASGTKNLIYRVPGTTSYSDYMWNGSSWVLMATYNNNIDEYPTPRSLNVPSSGGTFNSICSNIKQKFVLELGSIDASTGVLVENTTGNRMRNKDYVLSKNNTIEFYIDRVISLFNIVFYKNKVFQGSEMDVTQSVSLNPGSYSYTFNENFEWDSYKLVFNTSDATADDVFKNYSFGNITVKESLEFIQNKSPKIYSSAKALTLISTDYSEGIISDNGTIHPNLDLGIHSTNLINVNNYDVLIYAIHNNNRVGIAKYDKNQTFLGKNEWYTGSGEINLDGAYYIYIDLTYPKNNPPIYYDKASPCFCLSLKSNDEIANKNIEYKNPFELGSIDGDTGEEVENLTGNRIRTKYIRRHSNIIKFHIDEKFRIINLILYKNNIFQGTIFNIYNIDGFDPEFESGDYVYNIVTSLDWDSYRLMVEISGVTSDIVSNNYSIDYRYIEEYLDDIYTIIKTKTTDDIDIDTLTTNSIYQYYDDLVSKYPNYISMRVLGYDSSNQHEIREYVATLRNRFAYLYKDCCYAWKNGSDIIYTKSISPRIGDNTYSDQLTTSTGYTVTNSNCVNKTITVNSIVYDRYTTNDINADIIFETISSAETITRDNKTYTRYPNYDKSTVSKKTIVNICNEHGPGPNGDPREPSVVMYYLLKALTGETREDPYLDWIKKYAKLVIIPVSNPYAYDEEGDPSILGNLMGRVNSNGVNINRNYPTSNWVFDSGQPSGSYGGSEIETQYNINCIMSHKADIAIDLHCLGPNSSNYNQWHYAGGMSLSIPDIIKMEIKSTYNLVYSSYGQNESGHGDTFINENNIDGCLSEMSQGYDSTLHSQLILNADRKIWLGILEYYNIFSL